MFIAYLIVSIVIVSIVLACHPQGHQAAGHSSIWTSDGVVVTQAGPETGAIARATLI